MDIGIVGLGRMGANMATRLLRDGHRVVAHDRAPASVAASVAGGAVGAADYSELVRLLPAPRVVWLMIPAGAVDRAIDELAPALSPGDVIVDGGNSWFQDDIVRARTLGERGIHYVDCGTSGGTSGLDRGYCLMIGGEPAVVSQIEPIFASLAPGRGAVAPTPGLPASTAELGYLHCGGSGAGHFVKMVHNAIEYGMMAAFAEGFNVLRQANAGASGQTHDAETTPLRHPDHYLYEFDVAAIAELWRRGSVISSWLLDLTARALAEDAALSGFAGRVSDSGEGRWTLAAANDLAVPVPVIAGALFSRFASRGEADYQNRLLSAMRLQFGGHQEKGAS